MKLTNIKRVAKEELQGAPSWVDPMLTAYNDFMEQATQALFGKLTYGDNFLCKIKTNSFKNGTELVIANPFTGGSRPIGIHPIYMEPGNLIDSYNLVYKSSNNELGITFNFKSPDSYLFLTRNANQSINDSMETKVIWTTTQYSSGGGLSWSSTTNPTRITCVNGGNYLFEYTGSFAANIVGQRLFYMAKNNVTTGTGSRLGTTSLINSGTGNYDISASRVIPLKSGDYVELIAYQNSGGALNLLGNGEDEVQLNVTYLGGNTDITSNVTYILIGG